MNFRIQTIVILLLCVLWSAQAVSAVYADDLTTKPFVVPAWHWIDEDWTGSDTSYQEMRNAIDALKSGRKLTSDIIKQYYTLHRKKPDDSNALFQWAYASFQASQINSPVKQESVVAPGAFEKVPSPKAYDYARLRFLVWAHELPDAHLQKLGERLLDRTPDDSDVMYYLIQCYKPWHSALERRKALSLAHDLIRSQPNRAGAYSALAGVYYSSWMVSHQRADAIRAISAYQDYLRIAPENYAWRQNAASIIQYIKVRM